MRKQLAASTLTGVLENMGRGLLVFEQSADSVDGSGCRVIYSNREAASLLGLTVTCLPDKGCPEWGGLPALVAGTLADGSERRGEASRPTADGENWIRLRCFPLPDKRVGVLLAEATAAKEAEQRAAEQAALFRLVSENSQDCLCLHGGGARYFYASPSIRNMLGYEPEEVIGLTPFDLANPDDLQGILEPFRRLMLTGVPTGKVACRYRHKDGSLRWLETVVSKVENCPLPEVLYLSSTRDISERKALETQLTEMGYHDSLTGLYNRGYFEEEMRRLDRRRGGTVGLIIFDVDALKLVNDALGHVAGDDLLKRAARTLERCFRHGDLIARIGGDEFAVLMNNVTLDHLREAGRRVTSLTETENKGAPQTALSLSLGYALGPDAGTPMRDLFRAADDNMYRTRLYRGKGNRGTIVNILKRLLTERDFAIEEHADRLEELALRLGRAAGLSEERLGDLALFAHFHDVGKVGVPDAILHKPGPLTRDERIRVERHTDIGYRIASASNELLPIADWILRHHEWWNGHGYPLKLKGERIPLECRILAIVDAYDAMTSDRPYRKAMTTATALDELKRCAGSQFDPALVEIFLRFDFKG